MHVGTLVSIVFVFWRDIIDILKKPFGKMPLMLIAATIPTVIIALLLKDSIETAFKEASWLGVGFIFTGLVLWSVELIKSGVKSVDGMKWQDAAIIGIAQGIAIFPAVSRSGSTIAGGLFRGLDRKFAARFSFLMSIPAILGSIVFQIKDFSAAGETFAIIPILIGTAVSAIAGFLAIQFMMKMIVKKSLKIFAYYVFALGSLVLADQLFFGIVF
jgi:undecaprenyl-diphosphatase